MQPKTEEFLYFMLWSVESLFQPTFRNLTESYESWAYRNGLLRQLGTLEKARLLERDLGRRDERVYRLTEQGRLRALGGRDPERQWSRPWDGQWRLVLFDVPTAENSRRNNLRLYLRSRFFGYLQNSVWITPDPLHEERELLRDSKISVESLLFLEARPCADENDSEIVAGAWDFTAINQSYARHQKVLAQRPKGTLRSKEAAEALRAWARDERLAWLKAVSMDPLLPERLHPAGYLGCSAWQERRKVLHAAGKQLQTFGA